MAHVNIVMLTLQFSRSFVAHLVHLRFFGKYDFHNAASSTLVNCFSQFLLYLFPVTFNPTATFWIFEI